MISAELADFVHGAIAIVLATADGELRPQIRRAWGPLVDADGGLVTMCVESGREGELVPGTRIAVTCVRPSTYRGLQFKGEVVATAPPTPEQLTRLEAHATAFEREAAPLGLTDARRIVRGEFVATSVVVNELFHQTPGPGAGEPL